MAIWAGLSCVILLLISAGVLSCVFSQLSFSQGGSASWGWLAVNWVNSGQHVSYVVSEPGLVHVATRKCKSSKRAKSQWKSTFRVSACITLINVALTKMGHWQKFSPDLKCGERDSKCDENYKINYKGLQKREKKNLWPFLQSTTIIFFVPSPYLQGTYILYFLPQSFYY